MVADVMCPDCTLMLLTTGSAEPQRLPQQQEAIDPPPAAAAPGKAYSFRVGEELQLSSAEGSRKLRVEGHLGQGGYAEVVKVSDAANGLTFALKVGPDYESWFASQSVIHCAYVPPDKYYDMVKEDFAREATALQAGRRYSPHVLECLVCGWVEGTRRPALLLELCTGSLKEKLDKEGALPERQALEIWLEVSLWKETLSKGGGEGC
jgi:hypothetical protein